ncbi:MAG: hypothetical protein J6J83_07715 [Oscillospiraceae bacterium]|nr:hypothetical protein [Oscillospiraceae bacterium]
MEKKKQQFMDVNKETAMRLWNQSFGKETKVIDFAGRVIAKAAYNDRNSEYGWNLDHILPQSKGGVTADYNLVCCHILTNDEKASRFPCFRANGTEFEIIKVQRHYEIRPRSQHASSQVPTAEHINFYDSAAGLRFFKKMKGVQNKPRFVGTVLVRLSEVSSNALIDFIEELFDTENISFSQGISHGQRDGRSIICFLERKEIRLILRNYDLPLKEDARSLLDKCVLLNTYLSSYFEECGYVSGYDIYYKVDYFKEKSDIYREPDIPREFQGPLNNSLFVNGLVLENTGAGEKVELPQDKPYAEYNFVFTKLSDNLKKEANGK